MASSASQGSNILCGVCNQRCAIYTCPRCVLRTCSLPCSKSHKELQACSGKRDKTAYVPMNKYGWGTMANDYAYLEEVGRKAAEWGLDIVKGGFLASAAVTSRGRGRGRGRGARNVPRGGARGKRDLLKMQLDARDIDMEILPPGMEKRRLNQSTWDARSKSPLITLEFVFHPVKDPIASLASPTPLPFTLLIHRIGLDSTISNAIRRHIRERGKKDVLPPWLKSLLSSADEECTRLVYLLAQHSGSPANPLSKVYHKLDSTLSLLTILRNKTFVEYPTIDVWEDGDFTGVLVEADGTYVVDHYEPRPAKRRRLDAVGGRKVIRSLLGGYKSQEEEEQEENNVMDMLDNYGSDEDHIHGHDAPVTTRSESDEGLDSEDVEEPTLEDVRELFQAVGQGRFMAEDQIHWSEGEEEEQIDWNDSANDEAEELERTLKRQKSSHEPG